MTVATEDKTAKIRDLNDRLRQGDEGVVGFTMLTQGALAFLSDKEIDQMEVLQIVKDFSEFTDDNDPYGEHDFGKFSFQGQNWFWKIDYYEHGLKYLSDAPWDNKTTLRVMTIMLASEY